MDITLYNIYENKVSPIKFLNILCAVRNFEDSFTLSVIYFSILDFIFNDLDQMNLDVLFNIFQWVSEW